MRECVSACVCCVSVRAGVVCGVWCVVCGVWCVFVCIGVYACMCGCLGG